MKQAAAAIQADPRKHSHADGVVHRQSQPAQRGDQFAVRADAGAPPGQRLAHALEDRDFPADPAQRIRGEQTRDRAADHQRARRHRVSSA